MLNQPALYVGATTDPFCPPSGVEKQRKYLKNLKIIELDAHHGVMAQRPGELDSEVRAFLKENGW